MADLSAQERLQPSLLDRLVDHAPDEQRESDEKRTLTKQALRAAVLRDLSWLFNATGPLQEADERLHAHARRSVLNYGMPGLSGKLVSHVELFDLEQALRQAILDFEPRILPGTLEVRGSMPEDELSHHNVLSFEISGQLWSQPYPLELLLKTDLDLETGMVKVQDGKVSAALMRGAEAR